MHLRNVLFKTQLKVIVRNLPVRGITKKKTKAKYKAYREYICQWYYVKTLLKLLSPSMSGMSYIS